MYLTNEQQQILQTIQDYQNLAKRIMSPDFVELRKLGLITSNIGAPMLTSKGEEVLKISLEKPY